MAKKRVETPISFEGEKIISKSMDEVMHDSMLPYAEHVILERALPRVEDGLKPVQRRILYTMLELGTTPDKPHRKSARIVGDCLGKYHPHGDSSVYDAMVRMAQDFNMRERLVDGHGNFGSVDGDGAAAMRYTEARMTPLALELLRDLEKDTVKFGLNFDDTLKEPDLLPGRFPNLLVNGATGIAVGLATNIPPHNLTEAINAVILRMDKPDCSLDEAMAVLPCPDFPTGGFILASDEIRTGYETGRAKLTMRAKTHIEEQKNGRKLIVMTELPYQVNKAKLMKDISELTQTKKSLFTGVYDIRDESDRLGMRAVVELKKDTDAEKILSYLFKYSDMQATFGVNIVAIAEGKPQQLGLLPLLDFYIIHQENVVTKRTRFDLDAARKREHILAGLEIAILNIDEVIALIRASKTPKEARSGLMAKFALSEIQAQAILDLRLQRLTNLEQLAIEREHKDVLKLIDELEAILASPRKLRAVIKKELTEIRDAYPCERKTQIIEADGVIQIPEEEKKPVYGAEIAVLEGERLRRVPSGQQAAADDENVIAVISTASDKRIKLFTRQGACLTLAVEDIPEVRPGAKPVNLNTLMELEKGETLIAAMPELEDSAGKLMFCTRSGMVKLSSVSEYQSKTKRLAAIALKDGDELIAVQRLEEPYLLIVTKRGMSIRFAADTVPDMGRVAGGVKCIKLDIGDSAAFCIQTGDDGEILTVSDRGYAKRSFVFDFDIQGRNGKGLKVFDFKKNGSNGTEIAGVLYVREPFELVIEQKHGQKTVISTETVMIEQRAGRGQLTVMALFDDTVTRVYNGTVKRKGE